MTGRSVLAGLVAGALLPLGGSAFRKTEKGNEQFLQGRYAEALRSYTEAQVDRPEAPELFYDIGNVLYRMSDFERASQAFARALQSGSPELVGPASYNLGNVRFRQQDYRGAVKAYEEALRAAPGDLDAKRNLEIALLALERQRQSQQEDQQPPQEPEQPRPEPGEDEPEDPEESPHPEPAPPNEEPPPREPEGRMTPEQVERMLEGVEEQELENLRRRALQSPRPSERTTERDW